MLSVPGAPQWAVVQRVLATAMLRHGQPRVLQTDRGPCFVGPDGGAGQAVPGRVTLWLWGLDIEHRLIPAGKPQRNGVVERWQGAIERSWQGEPDGLAALLPVWNQGKAGGSDRLRPYRGWAGFRMERVWARLEQVRLVRRVSGQGTLSLWDQPVRVGQRLAGRTLTIRFDAARQLAVLLDERDVWVGDRPVPFLTAAWLWAGVSNAALDDG